MELQIKLSQKNIFPIGGFLIKGALLKDWLKELQQLAFSLEEVEIFPVPGMVANTIWGCFIITNQNLEVRDIGKNQLCQRVYPNFYIPENCIISPFITEADNTRIFRNEIHVFHPEFGFVGLTSDFNLKEHIPLPVEKFRYIMEPQKAIHIPNRIHSFQIKPVVSEDPLTELEEKVFPKRKDFLDKPLNLWEKGKLKLYKGLFKKSKDKEGINKVEQTGFMKGLDAMLHKFSKKERNLSLEMQEDYEDLEDRNQKQIDKLMDLFEHNPEEALKYAIPLDENGTSRGTNKGLLGFEKRWGNISIFGSSLFSKGGGTGNGQNSGGGTIDLGEHYQTLQAQYNKTALDLIKKGEYEKAAFVYLKLLKNYTLAAQALENGEKYQEAASIYLKHVKNKLKAAQCYEKGNLTYEAIAIYEELKDFNKVGDLYLKLNKKEKAMQYFEKTIEVYKSQNKFIAAADIYENKIGDYSKMQFTLLEGWEDGREAYNCLNQYFSNILNSEDLKKEIESVYTKKVTDENRVIFLKVIEKEYKKNNEMAKRLREIGYEIIAQQVSSNPSILAELIHFNPKDKQISKDVSRFGNKNLF